MTERASIVLSRNRAPPRKPRQVPDQSAKEEISLSIAIEELAKAIAELQELDRTMITVDQQINQIEARIAQSSTDAWDAMALEEQLTNTIEQRNHLSCSVLYAANQITHLGKHLIDEWRDVDLDNAARQLSQADGLFSRVAVEWNHLEEDPIWQRFRGQACPF
jgi:predicted transcriptional regulator